MIGSAFGLIKKSLGFTYHSTILNRINTHRNSLGSIIIDMQLLMVMNLNWDINRTLTPVGWRRTSALGSFGKDFTIEVPGLLPDPPRWIVF